MFRRLVGYAALAAALAVPSAVRAEAILTAVPQQLTAWVENYNPFNNTTVLPTVQDFMFEPLVVFNAIKGGEPNYRLATAYEYSDDLKSVTFTLRDGVKWSDGEAFNADDVVFTFNMVKQFPALDQRAVWTKISGVEKIDDHTVKINYNNVDGALIYQLVQVYIVPEHVWAGVADPVTFTNAKPVGSGPLTEIRRFTPQEYVQCRNPNYWDNATLKVDCMRMPQLANNDQVLTAAASGEIDWFGSFLPDIQKTYIDLDPDHHGYWFPAGSPVFFSFNLKAEDPGLNEAFNSINFRRAASMAMDRQAMVDIAGYGYPTVNAYASGLGEANKSWIDQAVEDEFGKYTKLDIEGAKAELAAGGFKDTDGDGFVETPSGKKISFDIIVPNGWTDWVNSVQLAVEGLGKIGVQATVATPESPAWADALISGKYKAAINSVTTGVTPHYYIDNALHSRNAGQNRFASVRYSNPELDAALDAFNATADANEQREIMNKIQRIIATDLPMVNVFNNPLWYEYSTKRFTGWFNAENPVARPVVYGGIQERLLHLLALKPVE